MEAPSTAEWSPPSPNKIGLHAWPAALFVQTAGRFQPAITVRNLIGLHITSLEMQDCSITLLKADDEILKF